MKTTRLSLAAFGLLAFALVSCGPSSDPFAPPVGGKSESFALGFHEMVASFIEGRETLSPEEGSEVRSYDHVFSLADYGYGEQLVTSAPAHVYDEAYVDEAYCFYFTFPDDESLPLSSFAGRKVECLLTVLNPTGRTSSETVGAPAYERPFEVVTLYDGEHCLLYSSMAVNYWQELYQSDYVADGELERNYAPLLSGSSVLTGEPWAYAYDWMLDFLSLDPSYLPLKGEGEPASGTLALASYGRSEGKLVVPTELAFEIEVGDAYRLEPFAPSGQRIRLDLASLR